MYVTTVIGFGSAFRTLLFRLIKAKNGAPRKPPVWEKSPPKCPSFSIVQRMNSVNINKYCFACHQKEKIENHIFMSFFLQTDECCSGGHEEMSSILDDKKTHPYMGPKGGGGCGVSANE